MGEELLVSEGVGVFAWLWGHYRVFRMLHFFRPRRALEFSRRGNFEHAAAGRSVVFLDTKAVKAGLPYSWS